MSSDGGRSGSDLRGGLLVISGPSGAGKTSICNELLKRLPNPVWSVSATTRAKRSNEQDGVNYRFVSEEEFESMRERGELLESAVYLGNLYGTPIKPVMKAIDQGKVVILEIDVQGGVQVARKMPTSIRVFILPPTPESLEARLKGRRTETAEQLERRLACSDGEIAFARDSGYYSHFVVNDILAETVDEVVSLVYKELGSG